MLVISNLKHQYQGKKKRDLLSCYFMIENMN